VPPFFTMGAHVSMFLCKFRPITISKISQEKKKKKRTERKKKLKLLDASQRNTS